MINVKNDVGIRDTRIPTDNTILNMTRKEICKAVKDRLESKHIGCFEGETKPLLLISAEYPGVWLEHVYDSVFYAMMERSKLYLAENTIDLFISYQTPDGQLPCKVLDGRYAKDSAARVGYSQIQECVSFAKLCLLVYRMNEDRAFLKRAYESSKRWVVWLRNNRMTLKRGLIEAFVGFDTGHDFSGRLEGLSCKGKYYVDGVEQSAAVLPEGDEVAPLIAVDMNCNYYGTLSALSEMARELGLADESKIWAEDQRAVKNKLFEVCFNKEDCFFYDVDKNGRQRKYLSSTVFHLFMEGVLDKKEDCELISELYRRHISNPDEFATPYPYPSMAVSDPSCRYRTEGNCWGYYSQGLIALRSTLWMKNYGFDKDFDRLCNSWLEAWTKHFDYVKLGQELDPISGIPTKCSEWYSSTMLFYLYAAEYGKKNLFLS